MKPTVICLTPVRNEAWILDRFLQCASLWADHIIIADQMSADGSREIACSYPKVKLIDNPGSVYDEAARQQLLINEARKIKGPRLLITLDADEIFTPDILTSTEWDKIKESQTGTVIKFRWANLKPGGKDFWYGDWFPWGFMDDGRDFPNGSVIHNARLPLNSDNPEIVAKEIRVLHFQYTHWERMRAKHRWYQQFELITFPEKRPLDIFRTYHHMFAIPKHDLLPVPGDWFKNYLEIGIDLKAESREDFNWFREESLKLFQSYGVSHFRKLHIWDIDWGKTSGYKDPRKLTDRLIQFWLIKTQPIYLRKGIVKIDRIIKKLFKY